MRPTERERDGHSDIRTLQREFSFNANIAANKLAPDAKNESTPVAGAPTSQVSDGPTERPKSRVTCAKQVARIATTGPNGQVHGRRKPKLKLKLKPKPKLKLKLKLKLVAQLCPLRFCAWHKAKRVKKVARNTPATKLAQRRARARHNFWPIVMPTHVTQVQTKNSADDCSQSCVMSCRVSLLGSCKCRKDC